MAVLGGVFFGLGEVLGNLYIKIFKTLYFVFVGGIIFGFIGGITAKQGREPVIIIGFVVSSIAYFLMFLNLPPGSPMAETLPGILTIFFNNEGHFRISLHNTKCHLMEFYSNVKLEHLKHNLA